MTLVGCSLLFGLLIQSIFDCRSRWGLSGQCGSLFGSVIPAAMNRKSRAKSLSPFRYFNSSPEVIRLAVLM